MASGAYPHAMAHDPTAHDVHVRPLADGEGRALAAVMRRSFGGLAAMLFSTGKTAFVAELGGRMVGGVTLGAFDIDAGRRGGVVKWVFTLPEARGLGVASLLLDRAMVWFEEQGVTDAFACIEGLNAGSSNRFAARGFEPLGFGEQVRRYGARLARVWWHANHVADVGHVLWARRTDVAPAPAEAATLRAAPQSAPESAPESAAESAPESASSGLVAFAGTLLVHALFGAVMLARLGRDLDLASLAQVAFAVGAVISVRTAALALTGRALGLHLRYRAWETGMTLTGAIALLFGGLFIAPGGFYPKARTWSPRELGPRLALVSIARGGGAGARLGGATPDRLVGGRGCGRASTVLRATDAALRRAAPLLPDDGVRGTARVGGLTGCVGGAGGRHGGAVDGVARGMTG